MSKRSKVPYLATFVLIFGTAQAWSDNCKDAESEWYRVHLDDMSNLSDAVIFLQKHDCAAITKYERREEQRDIRTKNVDLAYLRACPGSYIEAEGKKFNITMENIDSVYNRYYKEHEAVIRKECSKPAEVAPAPSPPTTPAHLSDAELAKDKKKMIAKAKQELKSGNRIEQAAIAMMGERPVDVKGVEGLLDQAQITYEDAKVQAMMEFGDTQSPDLDEAGASVNRIKALRSKFEAALKSKNAKVPSRTGKPTAEQCRDVKASIKLSKDNGFSVDPKLEKFVAGCP